VTLFDLGMKLELSRLHNSRKLSERGTILLRRGSHRKNHAKIARSIIIDRSRNAECVDYLRFW
jgi:hypothetical protein